MSTANARAAAASQIEDITWAVARCVRVGDYDHAIEGLRAALGVLITLQRERPEPAAPAYHCGMCEGEGVGA